VHVAPDLQGHHTWAWIAGQRRFSVVLRVLIVWLYNNTGRSVFAAILFHDMDNVSVFTESGQKAPASEQGMHGCGA
jgi:CAAX protease family protein